MSRGQAKISASHEIYSPLPLGEGARRAGEGNNDTKNSERS